MSAPCRLRAPPDDVNDDLAFLAGLSEDMPGVRHSHLIREGMVGAELHSMLSVQRENVPLPSHLSSPTPTPTTPRPLGERASTFSEVRSSLSSYASTYSIHIGWFGEASAEKWRIHLNPKNQKPLSRFRKRGYKGRRNRLGGERGIRTPVTLTGKAVFKTAAFDRSAISPPQR